jgi:putative lipoprotein
MPQLKVTLPLLLLFGGVTACTNATVTPAETVETPAAVKHITGQIGYRERIALRPGAFAEVELQDISIADRAAPVLAEKKIEFGDQQVPIDFNLSLDPEKLNSRGRYSVRAVINDAEGKLLFTSDTVNLVSPEPGNTDLGLILLRQNTVNDNKDEEIMRVYTCGETNAAAVYGDDMIRLKVEGESYDLPRVVSASGEKFEADIKGKTVMFWAKGEMAMLKIGDESYPECRGNS